MKSILSTLGVIAMTSTLAAADFHIVAAQLNDPFGGGSGGNIFLVPVDQTPNCNNLGVPNILVDDASSFGAACDGCREDQKVNDWKITRLEIYDGSDPTHPPNTKQKYGSLTAYLEADGRYGLNAGSGSSERRIGHCERVQGADLQCFQGLTTLFPTQIMTCFGESEPIDLR